MAYVDVFAASVPEGKRDAFLTHSREIAEIMKSHGATRVVDAWGDDVKDGTVTSFPMAVKAEPGEVVVSGWVEWPDRATRDAGWEKMMADPRTAEAGDMPFDGKRMFFSGFEIISDV